MRHPIFARVYAKRSMAQAERQAPHRRELLAGLSGRVLEVGCGNGLNFAHYPAAVTGVVALEPEPYLRAQAALTAGTSPLITVLDGTAEDVHVARLGLFDAIVFSLVLCTVADPASVLRRARTVLRPGGEARFFEHVVSDDPGPARVQHLCAPLWSLAAGGCRPDRDTLSVISAELDVMWVRKFDFTVGPRFPLGIVTPHMLVAARPHGSRNQVGREVTMDEPMVADRGIVR